MHFCFFYIKYIYTFNATPYVIWLIFLCTNYAYKAQTAVVFVDFDATTFVLGSHERGKSKVVFSDLSFHFN